MEYVNPAVIQTLGYSPEDFYADPELVQALLDGATPTVAVEPDPDAGRPTMRRWRRRDGTYADVEDRTIAIRDGDGNIEAIEGVARDISAELATQRELRASRERLDAVVSHVPVILWATDCEGRLTVLEGAGLRTLGVRSEDVLGLTPAEIHPDSRRYRRHLMLALRGRTQSVEVQLGDQTFMTRLGPLVDANGTIVGVTGMSMDVTPERRLVEALASEGRQRATVAAALGRFDPTLDLDALSRQIAAEMLLLEGVDHAGIIAFGPGILTYFIFFVGEGLPIEAGRVLPPARSAYLREQADKGPWVERWVPRAADGRYGLTLEAAGVRAAAYVPLRRGDTPWGLLAVGSREVDGPELLERRMSTLVEFGALTVALIGPALSTRNLDEVVRQELIEIMEREAFSPVYQPIVALADRSAIAFEALTRFDDGSPPERRFVEAESVGLGLRLEAATLALALKRCTYPGRHGDDAQRFARDDSRGASPEAPARADPTTPLSWR